MLKMHNFFTLLANVVEEVGVANVVQVIADSVANYVATRRLLCANYATIFWTPGVVHCIDLMLEDIGRLEWVQDLCKNASILPSIFIIMLGC